MLERKPKKLFSAIWRRSLHFQTATMNRSMHGYWETDVAMVTLYLCVTQTAYLQVRCGCLSSRRNLSQEQLFSLCRPHVLHSTLTQTNTHTHTRRDTHRHKSNIKQGAFYKSFQGCTNPPHTHTERHTNTHLSAVCAGEAKSVCVFTSMCVCVCERLGVTTCAL